MESVASSQAISASPSAFLAYLNVLTALAAGEKGARSMYLQVGGVVGIALLSGDGCRLAGRRGRRTHLTSSTHLSPHSTTRTLQLRGDDRFAMGALTPATSTHPVIKPPTSSPPTCPTGTMQLRGDDRFAMVNWKRMFQLLVTVVRQYIPGGWAVHPDCKVVLLAAVLPLLYPHIPIHPPTHHARLPPQRRARRLEAPARPPPPPVACSSA